MIIYNQLILPSMVVLILPSMITKVIIILSMMGDGFEHRAAGFLLKKELTYFSKVG